MCLLTIDAHDATPGTGIAAVEASVRTAYRTTCRVNGKRRACTRTESKRLTATHMAGTSYRIKTPRLRAGTQTFTFSARDVAGNRQAPGTKLVRRLR
jgi:hypothetical protein